MGDLSFEEARLVLLSGLDSQLQAVDQNDIWVPFTKIPEITSPKISTGYALRLAEVLEAEQMVEFAYQGNDRVNPVKISITVAGIRFLEDQSNEHSVKATAEIPVEHLGTVSSTVDIPIEIETEAAAASKWDEGKWGEATWGDAPASDRTVPLDHNAPEYSEAMKSLEEVIREFREDHTFGNNPPPERDRILDELETGRDHLKKQARKNGEIRFGTIKELLIEPLKWIAKTFGKEGLSKLAQEAIDFLIRLFG